MRRVKPFESVDNIYFSMNPPEVIQLLGEPSQRLIESDNTILMKWNSIEIEFVENRIDLIVLKDETKLCAEGDVLDFSDSALYDSENPYVFNDSYYFDRKGIIVFRESIKNSPEIYAVSRGYIKSIEGEIERSPRFRDIASEKVLLENSWKILAYVGIGRLRFGMTSEEVSSIIGSPMKSVRYQGEIREERYGCVVSYDRDGAFNQIRFDRPTKILLNGEDISVQGIQASAFSSVELYERKGYTVVFEYGIAIGKLGSNPRPQTIVLFSRDKVAQWKNRHRPIL